MKLESLKRKLRKVRARMVIQRMLFDLNSEAAHKTYKDALEAERRLDKSVAEALDLMKQIKRKEKE